MSVLETRRTARTPSASAHRAASDDGHPLARPLARLALAGVLVLSALLELVRLGQNGYANTYYSAAVRSMLGSWHNFFFVSADPNGLITVDKPPLALWLQALSAKLFGFAPLSLLVPEAICAVLAVALLYRVVAPRFGAIAGLASALCLAGFPAFVAVGRDNGVDPLLILLMLASCAAGLAAIESGRTRTLLSCAALAGLAFETKSLAALLCVPGIAAAYLWCAPGSLRRRGAQLALGGVVLVVVGLAWPLAVDLTPASQRPFVGGSNASNSELALELGYNGFGRVVGQPGGPGTEHTLTPEQLFPLVRPGVTVPSTPAERRAEALAARTPQTPTAASPSERGRRRQPLPFAGARSPLRIFGTALGDQAGWLIPLAIVGIAAIALVIRDRRDRRTAALLVLGGWLALELVVLDFSAGIVHPYYSSALGPGVAAMVGAGVVSLAALVRRGRGRRRLIGYGLALVGIAATLAVQLVLIRREGDPLAWRIPLAVACVLALAALVLLRARAGTAVLAAAGALLVAPLAYSFSVWLAPVNGTFPVAGPHGDAGHGGYGVTAPVLSVDRSLIRYVERHGATQPYALLTEESDEAAPLILLGASASAEGGYGAADQALSADDLAHLVAERRARYVLLTGPWALREGNGAAVAARLVCPEVPEIIWGGGNLASGSLLVDCAGQAGALRHPIAAARAFLRDHPAVHYTLP